MTHDDLVAEIAALRREVERLKSATPFDAVDANAGDAERKELWRLLYDQVRVRLRSPLYGESWRSRASLMDNLTEFDSADALEALVPLLRQMTKMLTRERV